MLVYSLSSSSNLITSNPRQAHALSLKALNDSVPHATHKWTLCALSVHIAQSQGLGVRQGPDWMSKQEVNMTAHKNIPQLYDIRAHSDKHIHIHSAVVWSLFGMQTLASVPSVPSDTFRTEFIKKALRPHYLHKSKWKCQLLLSQQGTQTMTPSGGKCWNILRLSAVRSAEQM